jgi:hypothetical protein
MSSNARLFGIVDAEDGSTKFLQNFGSYLPERDVLKDTLQLSG